jgi:hypothetical protein
VGVLRILSTLRGAGSAGLAVAERVAAPPVVPTPPPDDALAPSLGSFPSQAESAALLDPYYVGSAREAGTH